MNMERLQIRTTRRREFIDVTQCIRRLVEENGWRDGVVVVFSPHTTCGLTHGRGFFSVKGTARAHGSFGFNGLPPDRVFSV